MMNVRKRIPPDYSSFTQSEESSITDSQDVAMCPHLQPDLATMEGIPEHCLKALREGQKTPPNHEIARNVDHLVLNK